LTKNYFI